MKKGISILATSLLLAAFAITYQPHVQRQSGGTNSESRRYCKASSAANVKIAAKQGLKLKL